jgi:hypothetical protein
VIAEGRAISSRISPRCSLASGTRDQDPPPALDSPPDGTIQVDRARCCGLLRRAAASNGISVVLTSAARCWAASTSWGRRAGGGVHAGRTLARTRRPAQIDGIRDVAGNFAEGCRSRRLRDIRHGGPTIATLALASAVGGATVNAVATLPRLRQVSRSGSRPIW